MKKLSVSLFSVLAIVVAIGSSFTSSKESKLVSDWFTAQSPAVSLSVEAIANFNVAPFVGDITDECPSVNTSDKLCAIEHEYQYGTASQLDQTDLNTTNPTAIRYKP
jgi:hypothetical protein